MFVSTKGRYALRVMIDLAEHYADGFVPMKDVSQRQGLSLKYMEKIMPLLTKSDLVLGVHGKGGGYRLRRNPEEYTVGEIFRAGEGDLAPVPCLEKDAKPCPKAEGCQVFFLWDGFNKVMNNYFDSVTLADFLNGDPADHYII